MDSGWAIKYLIRYICNMKTSTFYFIAFLFLAPLSGCKSDNGSSDENDEPEVSEKNLTFEDRLNRHVTGSLSIPAMEKFSMKQYKAHMNADNFEDVVITVNRMEFALENAKESSKPEIVEKMGYMGNYNYFVFYDGARDKFSVPIPIPSSPKRELDIKFENIMSEAYKTLTVEYRIKESAFRDYYEVANGGLAKIFQMKVFDYIGTATPEAFYTELDRGSISASKDILMYEGKIKDYDPKNIEDIYSYEPVIEKKDKLVYRWIYNPATMKYMTPNPDLK